MIVNKLISDQKCDGKSAHFHRQMCVNDNSQEAFLICLRIHKFEITLYFVIIKHINLFSGSNLQPCTHGSACKAFVLNAYLRTRLGKPINSGIPEFKQNYSTFQDLNETFVLLYPIIDRIRKNSIHFFRKLLT
ncbi:hypothetical protein EGR_01415 [Echinococcus granulosus]|uniref:Uncharacterized protein n=1 Tax=Echinococcus granulosus TaxID=6210 RepID=W6UYR1_ECHGR|nr:hypothetical protein EGR_01415 [Echinococcus granulosus]EUB63792.1 hypothetical protein EGR_01415 [Echinococcus granulosus]